MAVTVVRTNSPSFFPLQCLFTDSSYSALLTFILSAFLHLSSSLFLFSSKLLYTLSASSSSSNPPLLPSCLSSSSIQFCFPSSSLLSYTMDSCPLSLFSLPSGHPFYFPLPSSLPFCRPSFSVCLPLLPALHRPFIQPNRTSSREPPPPDPRPWYIQARSYTLIPTTLPGMEVT